MIHFDHAQSLRESDWYTGFGVLPPLRLSLKWPRSSIASSAQSIMNRATLSINELVRITSGFIKTSLAKEIPRCQSPVSISAKKASAATLYECEGFPSPTQVRQTPVHSGPVRGQP